MKFALFRADGSHRLGLGHIMRCLAFAQGLEERGVKPVFVIRDYEQSVIELIHHHGCDVETIPGDSSFAEDASLTLEFASRYGTSLIVTDLSNADNLASMRKYRQYFQALKAAHKFKIILDEYIEDDFPHGIQIIPYYGAENMHPKPRGGTRLLLGPKYFIFRQEFVEAAGARREIKKDAWNILVTMGGSDPLNTTIKIAKVLMGLKTSLNLRIVIGLGFSDSVKPGLESILEGYPGNYEIIVSSDNMADLMLWSDLAIIAGGLTKYETAVTGTPSIIISQNAYEAETSREFEGGGSAIHLGLISEIGEAHVAKTIEKLLKHDVLRAEMAKKGRDMVDGQGIRRIISEIPREVLS